MDITIKEIINSYIEFLSKLTTNYDSKEWIPNCIECLQFALDNEKLLAEKPELYQDTLSTLSLLYSWIIDNEEWAYIELRQKFRNYYSPEEVGKSLKQILTRLNNQRESHIYNSLDNSLIDFKDINGNFKSVNQILTELSEQFKIYKNT